MSNVQGAKSTQHTHTERERGGEQSSAHVTDTQLFERGVKMLHILCSRRLFKLFLTSALLKRLAQCYVFVFLVRTFSALRFLRTEAEHK